MQPKSTCFNGIVAAFFIVILLAGCAAQKPGVREGDPANSYFAEQVVYPYKVEYREAEADDGTSGAFQKCRSLISRSSGQTL